MTWQIKHIADSFAFLSSLSDQAVDVILTDPPYSEHVHANMSSGTAMKRQVDGGKGGGIPRITLPFNNLQQYDFAQDLPRVARRWALSFCAVEDFGAYRDDQKQATRFTSKKRAKKLVEGFAGEINARVVRLK